MTKKRDKLHSEMAEGRTVVDTGKAHKGSGQRSGRGTARSKDDSKPKTDAETLALIDRVKQSDSVAFTLLSEKYSTVVASTAAVTSAKLSAMGKTSFAVEDLRQEATLALFKAAQRYDTAMADRVTFGLYAKICIRNAMVSLLRREAALMRRQKNAEEKNTHVPDIGSGIADRLALDGLLKRGRASLSEYEAKVLDEYISGKTAREIAKEVGQSPKSVSNAIYRIKVKLRCAARQSPSSGK